MPIRDPGARPAVQQPKNPIDHPGAVGPDRSIPFYDAIIAATTMRLSSIPAAARRDDP